MTESPVFNAVNERRLALLKIKQVRSLDKREAEELYILSDCARALVNLFYGKSIDKVREMEERMGVQF
jgi:hypothetical protein